MYDGGFLDDVFWFDCEFELECADEGEEEGFHSAIHITDKKLGHANVEEEWTLTRRGRTDIRYTLSAHQ